MGGIDHSGAKSVTPGGSVAGHTPGPWFTEYRLTMRGGYSQEVFDAEGKVIATAAWFPVSLTDTTTTTNREANARLIAAAPDLLELLQECRDYFASCPTYDAIDTDCLDSRCMEAITKATTGETRNAEGAL